MATTFKGRTEDADAPFLNAAFWEEGKRITGKVVKVFETRNEKNGVMKTDPAFTLLLDDAVELDGEEWDRVSVGAMSGIKMANGVAKDEKGRALPGARWQNGDVVSVLCTGFKAPKKEGYSPRVNFEIEVTRQ